MQYHQPMPQFHVTTQMEETILVSMKISLKKKKSPFKPLIPLTNFMHSWQLNTHILDQIQET